MKAEVEKSKKGMRYLLIIPLALALTCAGKARAQTPPSPPPNAPQPPPPPGELLNKINPFKKHKTTKANKQSAGPALPPGPGAGPVPGDGPPPPPNPLNLFKKKKPAN